jgi:phosphoglycolate phosphatase
MPAQLVIFDFDGTLADSWRDIGTALNHTLREARLAEASPDEVRLWVGEGVVRLVERAVPERERAPQRLAALVDRFRAHYERCCLDTTALYPGMAQCLRDLSAHTLAVLSNKPTPFLARMLAGLGVADCFAVVVGGDGASPAKPDPAAVGYVVGRIAPRPEAVWMVGDSALDIAGGRAAGARTIGCAWGLRGAEELRAAAADFVVEHPSEIPPLVNSRGLS